METPGTVNIPQGTESNNQTLHTQGPALPTLGQTQVFPRIQTQLQPSPATINYGINQGLAATQMPWQLQHMLSPIAQHYGNTTLGTMGIPYSQIIQDPYSMQVQGYNYANPPQPTFQDYLQQQAAMMEMTYKCSNLCHRFNTKWHYHIKGHTLHNNWHHHGLSHRYLNHNWVVNHHQSYQYNTPISRHNHHYSKPYKHFLLNIPQHLYRCLHRYRSQSTYRLFTSNHHQPHRYNNPISNSFPHPHKMAWM